MPFFLTLLLTVGFFLLSQLLKPKPKQENARPADLGDFNFPTATEGRVVPLVWGTVKLEGPNVVWYGDLKQRPIKEKVKTGLFSSSKITVGFKYFIGIQFGLCRGAVDSIRRIWIGDDEVFSGSSGAGTIAINEPSLFGGDKLGNGGIVGNLTFFTGTEAQNASAYLSDFQDEGGDTPAYRGTCYAVWERGYIGNSSSIKPWAFEVRRIPTGLSSTNASVNSGADANPAHVLYEILTDTDWGLGFPPADIDTTSFQDAADLLAAEGNGFSFVLDRPLELVVLIEELQRQIDGVVFINQRTGKWKINLARGGYTVGTLPLIDESNLVEMKDFTRGAWDDTTNIVRIEYTDRSRDYFGTFALAQDMANIRIQGVNVMSNQRYPGVKDPDLANQLATREIRSLSFPLAKAVLVVDRSFFDTEPASLVRWSDDDLGLTDLVMRVTKVDFGEIDEGKIELTLIQDVFEEAVGIFSAPPATGWTAPEDTLVAIPADDQIIFEAPKAFIDRDPEFPGTPNRLWAGARSQGDGASFFEIRTRTGANPFVVAGEVFDFFLVGELASNLSAGTANPAASVTIVPDPDTQQEILDQFVTVTEQDVGVNLAQILLVGNEFIGVLSASSSGSNVVIEDVYRGLLDSVPASHVAGTKVYMLFVSGNLTDSTYPPGSTQDVRLVSRSLSDSLAEGSATNVVVTLAQRDLRPYPPAEFSANGDEWPTSDVSLDVSFGAGEDNDGIEVEFIPRDFRTTDEIASALGSGGVGPNFPVEHNTRYRARVFDTSSGSVELFATVFATGDTITLSRTKILRETGGVLPTSLLIDLETRHTIESIDYDSLQDLSWEFPVESAELSGSFNLGVLGTLDVSNAWTAPSSGTYNFSLGTALSSGTVEARINTGSWTSVITATNTSGTFPGVTAGDIIEVRANGLAFSSVTETILLIDSPSHSENAYGIFAI